VIKLSLQNTLYPTDFNKKILSCLFPGRQSKGLKVKTIMDYIVVESPNGSFEGKIN